MKMENLSMDLARFVSSHYLPDVSMENTPHQASYFILELIFTLDVAKKKIIHTDMDILAASEHLLPTAAASTSTSTATSNGEKDL